MTNIGSSPNLNREIDTFDSNSNIHPEVPVDESPNPTTPALPHRNRASETKLSSSRPNNALIWALIDDSELGAERHKEAVAIMEWWRPAPWKGMEWCPGGYSVDGVCLGPKYQWTGTEWVNIADALTIARPAYPESKPSQLNASLTELFTALYSNPYGGTCTIAAKELNDQYEAWLVDPSGEEDNLWVTIIAFVRSEWRTNQCRKLIAGSAEIWIEIDDIFSDFVSFLRPRLRKYVHRRNLDGFISTVWQKFFFPEQQTKVFEYLNSIKFVNNEDIDSPTYKFQKHCVNTINIHSDQAEVGEGYLIRAKRNAEGKETVHRLTADRIMRDLDNPNTDFGKLEPAHKEMLKKIAFGKSQKKIAEELKVNEKTISLWLKSLKTKTVSIEQAETGENLVCLQDCEKEVASNVICINACADETFDLSPCADENSEVAA